MTRDYLIQLKNRLFSELHAYALTTHSLPDWSHGDLAACNAMCQLFMTVCKQLEMLPGTELSRLDALRVNGAIIHLEQALEGGPQVELYLRNAIELLRESVNPIKSGE